MSKASGLFIAEKRAERNLQGISGAETRFLEEVELEVAEREIQVIFGGMTRLQGVMFHCKDILGNIDDLEASSTDYDKKETELALKRQVKKDSEKIVVPLKEYKLISREKFVPPMPDFPKKKSPNNNISESPNKTLENFS